jgi:hypothetical protein
MNVPTEFLLVILLLAVVVVFAYFYVKRAQRRSPVSAPESRGVTTPAPEQSASADSTANERSSDEGQST